MTSSRPDDRSARSIESNDLFRGTPYRFVRILGMGGTACVYEVKHRWLGKRFGAKVLRAALASDAQARERMEIEARAAVRIRHPHLVDIVDFCFTPDGRPAIIMQLLEGVDLRTELGRVGPLGFRDAVRWAGQAASALAAAHREGIVHRDMKPENLFLEELATGERAVKVLDLGLAKLIGNTKHTGFVRRYLTEQDAFVGTPEYVSPEQLLGREIDARSDIYGLGVVLYEMIAGRRPFEHCADPMGACLSEEVVSPRKWRRDVPGLLERVVLRALQRDKQHRFQTADEFARALALADRVLPQQTASRWVVVASALIAAVTTFSILELVWNR